MVLEVHLSSYAVNSYRIFAKHVASILAVDTTPTDFEPCDPAKWFP